MIKDSIKFLAKDTAVYGLAGAVTKFIAIFTVPILVRVLSKDEYGTISTVIAITAVFTGFISLGQDSSIARWFYDRDSTDMDYRVRVTTTGFLIQVIATLFFCVSILFFDNWIGGILFSHDTQLISYWKVCLFSLPATSFLLFSNNLFKWTFQRNRYLFLTLGNSLVSVSLTLLLVVQYKMGILGALIAPVVSSNVFAGIGLFMNRQYISFSKLGDRRLIVGMLKYGLPFALIIVISSLLPSVDRLFLVRLVSMETLGEYSVSLKLAGLLFMIVGAFQISFGPYAFSIWKKPDSQAIFSKLLILYFSLLLFLGVCISVFGDIVIALFASNKYASSIVVLPLFLLAYAVIGLKEFSLLGISWSKKTFFNIITTLSQFLVLLLGNFLLVKSFTVYGAAFSLLLSNIFYIFFTFYVSNRYYPIHVDYLKLFILFISATIVHSFVIVDYYSGSTTFQLLKYIVFVAYLIFSFFIVTQEQDRVWFYTRCKSAISRLKVVSS